MPSHNNNNNNNQEDCSIISAFNSRKKTATPRCCFISLAECEQKLDQQENEQTSSLKNNNEQTILVITKNSSSSVPQVIFKTLLQTVKKSIRLIVKNNFLMPSSTPKITTINNSHSTSSRLKTIKTVNKKSNHKSTLSTSSCGSMWSFLFVFLNLLVLSSGQLLSKTGRDPMVIKVHRSSSKSRPNLMNDLDTIIQNQLNAAAAAAEVTKLAAAASTTATNTKKHLTKAEYEKLKREALIEAFKSKLLALLELDEAPSPSQVNITKDQIPEPILKEYERLRSMKQGGGGERTSTATSGKQRMSNGLANHQNILSSLNQLQFSRRLREMPTMFGGDDAAAADESDEEILRFNGSIVQQLTLLPKKCKKNEININNKNNDINNSNNNNNNKIKNLFLTLSCFSFSLTESEFEHLYIKSSDLYIKFESALVNKLLFLVAEALSGLQLDAEDGASLSLKSNLYLEVNGVNVKVLDMAKLSKHMLQTAAANNEVVYFETADIQQLVEDEIYKRGDDPLTAASPALLKIKLLFKNDALNRIMSNEESSSSSSLIEEMTGLFSQIDENVALHVKFGEKISAPPTTASAADVSASEKIRTKRSSANSSSSRKSSSKSGSGRHYRDCADLRKAGFSPTNFTCCREAITFSMEQIGWSHWILSPKVIEYKYCRGGCLTGTSPRFDNTQIVYKMFELSHTFEAAHCCNIYDYEEDIPFIYGTPPNYLTKMISLNAKNCLCS